MSGKRHPFHASWSAGFDDDGHIAALRATLTSDGGWSLDLSEPVLARALCHVDNAYWIPDIEVHGRIAKTNKTSQTAFRGFGGPQGMLVIEDILGRCAPLLGLDAGGAAAPQPLPSPGRPPRTASRCATPSGCCGIWQPGRGVRGGDPAPAGDRRVQRRPPAHQAGAGHHAGEVRHLLQPHRLQPGRRARARVQGRLGAGQPRRHRDGPGPAHQDAPGRGDRAGRAAAPASGWRRPAPTRCPTPRPPRPARAPTSTAARSRTPASRSASGSPRSRPAGSASTPPTCASPTARSPGSGSTTRELGCAEVVHDAYHQRVQLWAAGFYRTEGLHWDAVAHAGRAVQVLRLRRRRRRGRGRRLHRRLPPAARRHRPRRRRQPLAAGRPRPDRGRLRPGRRLADPGGPALGRERRARAAAGWPPSRPAPTSCPASPRCPRSSTSRSSSRPTRTAPSTAPRRSASRR